MAARAPLELQFTRACTCQMPRCVVMLMHMMCGQFLTDGYGSSFVFCLFLYKKTYPFSVGAIDQSTPTAHSCIDLVRSSDLVVHACTRFVVAMNPARALFFYDRQLVPAEKR
jgi:hypothetical protein